MSLSDREGCTNLRDGREMRKDSSIYWNMRGLVERLKSKNRLNNRGTQNEFVRNQNLGMKYTGQYLKQIF